MPDDQHDYSLTERDPSALFGLAGTAVASVLALLAAFGVDLSAEQQAAILGVLAGIGPLATALLIRRKAFSPAAHYEEVETALHTPAPLSTPPL